MKNNDTAQLPAFFLDHSPLLQMGAKAAFAAGEIVKEGYQKSHQIDTKSVGDLVSQVDFEADRAATAILKFSGLPILSEELSPETNDTNQKMWVVDPLDGTTAYLMGAGPQFSSVLVAVCENGLPILGITYFPMTDEWFYAEQGCGAWKNGKRLVIKQPSLSLGEVWVEMNQYGDTEYETDFFRAARRSLRSNQGAQIATSTFPHAGVAMRIADQNSRLCAAIHDNNPSNVKQGPWDIAANQIIFEEAGGVFLNPRLERTSPFVADPVIVAASRELAASIMECVEKSLQSTSA